MQIGEVKNCSPDVFSDVVKWLLDNGAELNALTKSGAPAFSVAANEGSKDTVEYLLEREGIKVNLADDNGCTALHVAALGVLSRYN